MKRRLRFVALVSIGAFAGSLFVVPPTASAQIRPAKESIDDLFIRVAERMPTFAGMFIDQAEGKFFVRVKGGNRLAGARAGSLLQRELFADHGFLGRLEVLDAEYSYLELNRWFSSLRTVLSLEAVETIDIDEKANRLAVGVSSDEAQAAVGRHVAEAGIPSGAVEFRRVEPIEVHTSVRSRHRPLVGGLQISDPGGNCTLGFNAVRSGVSGFVTASHCTNTWFAYDGIYFYQGAVISADRVGRETFDPALFQGGACVWAGWKCRWSDAAFVRKDAGVSSTVGRIARPQPSLVGWNGLDTFRIVGEAEFSLMGEEVTKVGRTTGRTKGTVTATCVDTDYPLPNVSMLCQESAGYLDALGDSGAPVFRIIPNTNNVVLVGLNWGGYPGEPYFSPFGYGIEDDLGFLTTCASGYSC